eukprot:5909-Heterococcus_DN1.PRE.2
MIAIGSIKQCSSITQQLLAYSGLFAFSDTQTGITMAPRCAPLCFKDTLARSAAISFASSTI